MAAYATRLYGWCGVVLEYHEANGHGFGFAIQAAAKGGVGGVPQGASGGAGATGTTAPTTGGSGFSKGGGGGGGVGRIWIRYRADSPPTLRGTITPAPGLDPTLP